VITPIGNGALVKSTGLRKVEELDWWQDAKTSPLPLTLTPAHHFSARTPFDRNRALWGGFTIAVAHRRIYFAGDSAYAPFFVRCAGGSARSTWRCSRSAPTSRDGSCRRFT
jgi:L-ascorbate metabolism protein UlaG (beta-lactamase superfamily)